MTQEEIYKRADIYVQNKPLANGHEPELKRGFIDGAHWMQKIMIEMACTIVSKYVLDIDDLVDAFRKELRVEEKCDCQLVSIRSLPFSTRTINALEDACINNLADLLLCEPRWLMKLRNFGKSSLTEIIVYLDTYKEKYPNIRLDMDMEEIKKIYL